MPPSSNPIKERGEFIFNPYTPTSPFHSPRECGGFVRTHHSPPSTFCSPKECGEFVFESHHPPTPVMLRTMTRNHPLPQLSTRRPTKKKVCKFFIVHVQSLFIQGASPPLSPLSHPKCCHHHHHRHHWHHGRHHRHHHHHHHHHHMHHIEKKM